MSDAYSHPNNIFNRKSNVSKVIITQNSLRLVINSKGRLFLEELPIAQLGKKFFALYARQEFIAIFTNALHRILPMSHESNSQPYPQFLLDSF
jgi:hypothetical protein